MNKNSQFSDKMNIDYIYYIKNNLKTENNIPLNFGSQISTFNCNTLQLGNKVHLSLLTALEFIHIQPLFHMIAPKMNGKKKQIFNTIKASHPLTTPAMSPFTLSIQSSFCQVSLSFRFCKLLS